jgi:hypothetical protein
MNVSETDIAESRCIIAGLASAKDKDAPDSSTKSKRC